MSGKENSYREPLLVDEHGLYVTVAQMDFFLNRPAGESKFKAADLEFLSYYKNCCLYNLVFDMMEDNPACAKMYWDSDAEWCIIILPNKRLCSSSTSTGGSRLQLG